MEPGAGGRLCGAVPWSVGADPDQLARLVRGPPDPLAGVLAIVLAMPWSFALQWLHGGPWPGMLVVLAGMAANVGVILWLGRGSRRRL